MKLREFERFFDDFLWWPELMVVATADIDEWFDYPGYSYFLEKAYFQRDFELMLEVFGCLDAPL